MLDLGKENVLMRALGAEEGGRLSRSAGRPDEEVDSVDGGRADGMSLVLRGGSRVRSDGARWRWLTALMARGLYHGGDADGWRRRGLTWEGIPLGALRMRRGRGC